MKRFFKLSAAAVLLALTVCAFCFMANAEGVGTENKTAPEIAYANIAYEGNYRMLLAVDASTVSGGSVTVEVWDGSKPLGTYSASKAENIPSIDPVKTYYIVETNGIAPKNMGVEYKYQATDANGNKSELRKISVAEYFYSRLFINGMAEATEEVDIVRRDFYLDALEHGAKAENLLYNLNQDQSDNIDVFVTDLLYAKVPGYEFDNGFSSALLKNSTTKITLPGDGMYLITKYAKGTLAKSETTAWGGSEITLDAHTIVSASGSGEYYNNKSYAGTRVDGASLLTKLDANPNKYNPDQGSAYMENGRLVYSGKGGYSTLSWRHSSDASGLTSPAMIFEADISLSLEGSGQVGAVRLCGNGKELRLNMQFHKESVYISYWGSRGVELIKGQTCNLRIEVDYANSAICYYVDGKLQKSESDVGFINNTSNTAIFGFSSSSTAGGIMTFDNVYIGMAEAASREEIIADRFAELEAEVSAKGYDGNATASAIKDLYSLYSDDIYLWIADLYDPSIGGFYYSASAKNTEGYLPDIESTLQALNLIQYSGLNSNPASYQMKEKIVAFVNGLQSDSDGYFYHPQWEELEITDERRGRDQMWALRILSMFGAKPLYTTGGVTGSEGEPGTSAAALTLPFSLSDSTNVSRVVACAATLDHLKDEASFKAYLDGQNWNDAYTTGNRLAAQVVSIKDAGLLDYLITYLNGKQNQSNGMWDAQSGYRAVNGFFKIASIYKAATTVIPNSDLAAAYCIDTLDDSLNGDEGTVCWVYNVWYSLDYITSLLEESGEDENTALARNIRASLRTNAPAYIAKAKEIYSLFQKEDGSFSFNQKSTSSHSQGMPVAVPGTDEGDVNATYISSIGLSGCIFGALGYNKVDIYTYHDYAMFLNELNSTTQP